MSIKAQILVKNRNIDQYYHDGKIYVEGRKGSEYIIQLTNDSLRRKKVVISVDGINVISGDTDWSQGYIIDGQSTLKIPGWLKDKNQVAKFVFSSASKSYNQHNVNGDQNNIGVIGVAVYDEQKPKIMITEEKPPVRPITEEKPPFRPYYPPIWDDRPYYPFQHGPMLHSTATSARSYLIRSVRSTDSVGTGWGNNKEFKTVDVYFNSREETSQLIEIFYNSRKNLENMGIVFKNKQKSVPNAFPGLKNKYCPPPY